MFKINPNVINPEELKKKMSHDQAGAFCSFEGWVRNHNDGKPVDQLEYEAYTVLAEKEGLKIVEEAKEKFDILDAYCEHHTGLLQIGGIAVWVGVSSKHRQAGFEACQYIIDEVKSRVPIWKKEFYSDGTTEWVYCPNCAHDHDHHHSHNHHSH